MTRNFTCLILLSSLLICLKVNGQNSVGIGTANPNSKAVLELVSPGNNQGLMVPRLTTAQRTAGSFTSTLTATENGLLVFDSDDQKFYYWQINQWLPIRSGSDTALTSGTGITITGNTISAVDGSVTNEIQDLSLTGNTLKITNNPTATAIDLSPFAGVDTDDQNLQDVLGRGNNANNTKITNLGAPTAGTDAATKLYVDNQTGGNNLITSINNASGFINTGRIASGTNGQFLTTVTGVPTWSTVAGLPPNGAASGDLTGTYPGPTIAAGKVTSSTIFDGTVASIDIADGTIANVDIANVDASKITTGTLPVVRGGSGITAVVPGAVAYGGATNFAFTAAGTSGQLLQSNGTGTPTWVNAPSATGTAGGDLTGSYPNPTIIASAITSAKILDGTIVNADIANVDASKITTGTLPLTVGGTGATSAPAARTNLGLGSLAVLSTVTTSEITDGTIANVDILNVDALKITTGTLPVTRGGSGITAVVPGAIAYGGATNFAFTAAGTAGQLLQSNGIGTPTWVNAPAPTGAAGGDLTGSYPNPTIITSAITSSKILDGTIINADIANVDASKITTGTLPLTVGGTGATTAAAARTNLGLGSLALLSTITSTEITDATIATADLGNASVTDAKIATGITVSKITPGTGGQFLTTVGTTPTWSTISSLPPNGVASGDLSGNYPNPVVDALQGRTVSNTAPTLDQVLKWNGTAWAPGGDNDSGLVLPYSNTQTYGNSVFDITNKGGGGVSDIKLDNPGSKDYAIRVSTNGSNGGAGLFTYENTTGAGSAVEARSGGLGRVVFATQENPAATNPTIDAIALSTSPAIRGVGAGNGLSAFGGVSGAGGFAIGLISQYIGTGTGWAIYGSSTAEGYAGVFQGRVNISGSLSVGGTLSKASGTFKIDHPLDPTNKFLYHSFVESPDMKNIYDGVITLDANGEGDVLLPNYFEALNKDFRYQLTCVGGFAQVYVSKEVSGNRFSIAGGRPNLKVSWQITGIRKDAYAEKNPVNVEVDKTGDEQGKYLYPAAYGLPESMGINSLPTMSSEAEKLLKKH